MKRIERELFASVSETQRVCDSGGCIGLRARSPREQDDRCHLFALYTRALVSHVILLRGIWKHGQVVELEFCAPLRKQPLIYGLFRIMHAAFDAPLQTDQAFSGTHKLLRQTDWRVDEDGHRF